MFCRTITNCYILIKLATNILFVTNVAFYFGGVQKAN